MSNTSDLINETRILLRGGRFVRETIEQEDLGTQESVLASCIRPSPAFVPCIAPAPSNVGHVHMIAHSDKAIVMCEMTSLPVDCVFRPQYDTYSAPIETGKKIPYTGSALEEIKRINATRKDTGLPELPLEEEEVKYPLSCYLPVFSKKAPSTFMKEDDILDKTPFIWPSKEGKLLFVMTAELLKPMTSTYCFYVNQCYIFVLRKGELFALRFPNIYDDGRVCMGHDWEDDRSGGRKNLLGAFTYCYHTFQTTAMNGDLSSNASELLKRGKNLEFIMSTDKYSSQLANFLRPSFPAFMDGFNQEVF